MADLLPSTSDATPSEDAEPRVVGVDSDAADDVLAALSSETARELLGALHEDPATPSELADAVDTSLQNTQYHLGNLEDADVVEVADTIYSEKGREMKVYAPADQPLVLFAGQEEESSTLKTALSRLLGGVGIVGAASLALHRIAGQTAVAPPTSGGGGAEEDGGAVAGDPDGDDGVAGGDADGGDVDPNGGDGNVYANETSDDVSIADKGGDETAELTETLTTSTETAEETTAEETVRETTSEQETVTEHMAEATGADTTTTAVNETVEAANDSASSAVELGANAGLPPGLLLFVAGTIVVSVWVFFCYVDR